MNTRLLGDYKILSRADYLRIRTWDVLCGTMVANVLWVGAGFIFGWFA